MKAFLTKTANKEWILGLGVINNGGAIPRSCSLHNLISPLHSAAPFLPPYTITFPSPSFPSARQTALLLKAAAQHPIPSTVCAPVIRLSSVLVSMTKVWLSSVGRPNVCYIQYIPQTTAPRFDHSTNLVMAE